MTRSIRAGAALALAAMLSTALASAPQAQTTPFKAPALSVPADASLYLVFSNAAEGKDKEFGDWYDTHMASLARLPGFVSAQRFRVRSRDGRADPKFRYVTLYVIQGDPVAALAQIGPATKEGRVVAINHDLAPEFDNMLFGPVGPPYVNAALAARR